MRAYELMCPEVAITAATDPLDPLDPVDGANDTITPQQLDIVSLDSLPAQQLEGRPDSNDLTELNGVSQPNLQVLVGNDHYPQDMHNELSYEWHPADHLNYLNDNENEGLQVDAEKLSLLNEVVCC